MSQIDPARLARLPAWARDEITGLQRRVADLLNALARLEGTTGEHYVEARAGATPFQRRFDDYCEVVFSLGGRRGSGRGDIAVRRVHGNALDICGLNGPLAIRPTASNRFTVVEEER